MPGAPPPISTAVTQPMPAVTPDTKSNAPRVDELPPVSRPPLDRSAGRYRFTTPPPDTRAAPPPAPTRNR